MREGPEVGAGFDFVGGLVRYQLEPVMISYSAEISACEKGQNWEQALSLLEDWCETSLSQL